MFSPSEFVPVIGRFVLIAAMFTTWHIFGNDSYASLPCWFEYRFEMLRSLIRCPGWESVFDNFGIADWFCFPTSPCFHWGITQYLDACFSLLYISEREDDIFAHEIYISSALVITDMLITLTLYYLSRN